MAELSTHSVQSRTTLLYVALQYLPGLGPQREARLFKHFSSIDELLAADTSQLRSLRIACETRTALHLLSHRPEVSKCFQRAQHDCEACAENGWQIVHLEHPDYPAQLREIATAPPLLYVQGDVKALSTLQIAMVGSRKASASGLCAATDIANGLALAGVTITSGLALGIDSACHKAALSQCRPTVAVLGSGLQNIYPRRNINLAKEIAECGALVSEFPITTAPQAKSFPQRNRIISGLSHGVAVVEARQRSGSLITARYALEQNREVFAVPGSIYNEYSAGCIGLIQQGATLLTNAEDILQALPEHCLQNRVQQRVQQDNKDSELTQFSDAEQELAKGLAAILTSVGFEPTSGEQIIQNSGHTAAQVAAAMIQLQIMGRVEMLNGCYLRIR